MDSVNCKITQGGLDQLKAHKRSLEEKLTQLDAQMVELALSENTSENIEFLELRREKVFLQDEIQRIESVLEKVILIKEKTFNKIEPGCRIHLQNHEICYILQLVSTVEANSLQGKVSCSSPIGVSLLGRRVGETVMIRTPLGETQFDIISIR